MAKYIKHWNVKLFQSQLLLLHAPSLVSAIVLFLFPLHLPEFWKYNLPEERGRANHASSRHLSWWICFLRWSYDSFAVSLPRVSSSFLLPCYSRALSFACARREENAKRIKLKQSATDLIPSLIKFYLPSEVR